MRCAVCKEESDELVAVTVEGRRRKLCESCAEEAEQEGLIAEEAEAAVQQMMGYQGRR